MTAQRRPLDVRQRPGDRRIRGLVYLCAVLGLVGLTSGALSASLAGPLALLTLGALFLFDDTTCGQWLHARRNRLVWLLVPITLGLVFVQSWVNAIFALAAWLQVIAVLDHRAPLGPLRVVTLAFTHFVAGALVPAGLGFGVAFVAFALLAPPLLLLSQLRAAALRQPKPAGEALHARTELLATLPNAEVRRWTWLCVALAGPLLATTFAVFWAFPRIGHGLIPMGLRSEATRTGLSDAPSVGTALDVLEDQAVVARLTFSGATTASSRSGDSMPRAPLGTKPPGAVRLRALVHDAFDGQRWRRRLTAEQPLLSNLATYRLRRWPEINRDPWVDVLLENLDLPVLAQLDETIAISLHDQEVRRGLRRRPLWGRSGREVRYRGAPQPLHYRLWLDPTLAQRSEKLSAEVVQANAYLEVPPSAEALTREARRLVGHLTTPEAQALALHAYFRESGAFTYTLTDLPQGPDALSEFVLRVKRGHCELFASSYALMLRGLGIPARYVTGFAGGEWNDYGNYLALRQADAHAWVEAYLGERWITLDPTPTRGGAARTASGWDRVRAYIDAAQARWRRWVLEHDAARQWRALKTAGRWLSAWAGNRRPQPGTKAAHSKPDGQPEARNSFGSLRWVLSSLLGLAALLPVWLFWRRRVGRAPGGGRKARQALRRLDHAFRTARAPRPAARLPSTHLAEAPLSPEARSALASLLSAYESARFGNTPIEPVCQDLQPEGHSR